MSYEVVEKYMLANRFIRCTFEEILSLVRIVKTNHTISTFGFLQTHGQKN
jgi:hypothetical protein